MKKRIASLLLVIVVAATAILPAFATSDEEPVENEVEDVIVSEEVEAEPEVEVEEEEVEVPVPVSPFFINGVQMAELEYVNIDYVYYATVSSFILAMDPNAVVEEENGVVNVSAVTVTEVVTDENGETANVEEETLTLTAELGSYYVSVNGRCLYVEDGIFDIDGKVALSIRMLARIFNLDAGWNGADILLTSQEGAGAYIESGDSYYDADLLYWLSRIIYSESGNQSVHGKIAVGNVVMNRLNNPGFPNTIKGVLFQKNQFSPAMSGSIYRTPNESSIVAAKLVLDGAVVLENALFFNRAGMNTFASRNRPYVATIGAHAFYN